MGRFLSRLGQTFNRCQKSSYKLPEGLFGVSTTYPLHEGRLSACCPTFLRPVFTHSQTYSSLFAAFSTSLSPAFSFLTRKVSPGLSA